MSDVVRVTGEKVLQQAGHGIGLGVVLIQSVELVAVIYFHFGQQWFFPPVPNFLVCQTPRMPRVQETHGLDVHMFISYDASRALAAPSRFASKIAAHSCSLIPASKNCFCYVR